MILANWRWIILLFLTIVWLRMKYQHCIKNSPKHFIFTGILLAYHDHESNSQILCSSDCNCYCFYYYDLCRWFLRRDASRRSRNSWCFRKYSWCLYSWEMLTITYHAKFVFNTRKNQEKHPSKCFFTYCRHESHIDYTFKNIKSAF